MHWCGMDFCYAAPLNPSSAPPHSESVISIGHAILRLGNAADARRDFSLTILHLARCFECEHPRRRRWGWYVWPRQHVCWSAILGDNPNEWTQRSDIEKQVTAGGANPHPAGTFPCWTESPPEALQKRRRRHLTPTLQSSDKTVV